MERTSCLCLWATYEMLLVEHWECTFMVPTNKFLIYHYGLPNYSYGIKNLPANYFLMEYSRIITDRQQLIGNVS